MLGTEECGELQTLRYVSFVEAMRGCDLQTVWYVCFALGTGEGGDLQTLWYVCLMLAAGALLYVRFARGTEEVGDSQSLRYGSLALDAAEGSDLPT